LGVSQAASLTAPRAQPLAAWLAWSFVAIYAVLAGASIALEKAQVGGSSLIDLWVLVAALAYSVVGALIVSSRPRHVIGWMFSVVALSFGISIFSSVYAVQALVVTPGTLPFGQAAAWFGLWTEIPAIAVVGLFLPLLFPDGHLPSRRWRPVAFGSAAIVAVATLSTMLAPATYATMGYPSIRNPFGLDQFKDLFQVLDAVLEPLLYLIVFVSGAALLARVRRADLVTRQQVKWFAFAAALMLASFVINALAKFVPLLVPVTDPIAALALTALPAAVGVAILRHGLYEIDLIINRTIVYVLLTAVLGGIYTAAIAFFQRLFVATTGQGSDLAIVATLFVLATVFTPVKNTLQASVDRRVKPVAHGARRAGIDDLVMLAELHRNGVLTDDEFAAKKKQILGI
jgi:Short C-terminal domain